MMKRIGKIFIFVFCLFFLMSNVNAKSLKQVREELARDIANRNKLIAEQKSLKNNINNAKGDISDLEKDINKYQNDIDDLLVRIDDLKDEIKAKKKEIENLLSFLQVSSGDNIYLEYVFEAKSLTDFIYRSAIVEELTEYNDIQIDKMYKMIEDSKKLQKELDGKITKNEDSINGLEDKLKIYNVSMRTLETAHSNIDDTIAERKKTLAYYEKVYKQNKCKETEDLDACLTVRTSTGLVRPLAKGRVSSEWGYRICPIHGRELHSGIDISVSMNSKVYASASGTVVAITRRSSCGGNIVTIRHNVKGKIYRTKYMHLASINVKMGQDVNVTTVIGRSGGGGYTISRNGGWDRCSTGAHLHFMVLPGTTGSSTINPRKMVKFPARGRSFSSRW